jgi:anti-sigma regulatory factor (Ser/Thr protein kinase)
MNARRPQHYLRASGSRRLRGSRAPVRRVASELSLSEDTLGAPTHCTEVLVYDRLLPAIPVSVGRIRAELDQALDDLDVTAARRADIALAVTEATTNVVLHAYVGTAPGPLDVTATVFSHELLVTVSDCGHGLRPRSDSPGAGLGLAVISRLSDAMTICPHASDTGTRLAATFLHTTPALRLASASDVREAVHLRTRADTLRDYVQALADTSTALHADTQALVAEARQVLIRTRQLRRERPSST